MAKIAQTRFPDPPEQYDPRAFSELVRQLEQIVLQLNSSYQEDNKNEILRRLNFLQGDGNDQDGTGIALSDLSVNTGSASGGGTLSYNNTTGVFNFAPAVTANRINQVINAVVGQTDTNVDSYIGSGASITPTSTSSKILIQVDGYVEQISGSAGNYAELQLRENTTAITTLNNAITYQYTVGARIPFSINFIRSPSTTSAVQYRIYHNEISGGATYRYYQYITTLMEVLQ